MKSFSHILHNHETNEGAIAQTQVLKMAEARDAGLWKIEDVVKDAECRTGFTIASRRPVPGKYDGLSNAELKKQLTARKLASGGNKSEMIARLKWDDDAEPGEHCSTKFSRWVGRVGCASKLSSAAGAGETDARAAPSPYAGMTVPAASRSRAARRQICWSASQPTTLPLRRPPPQMLRRPPLPEPPAVTAPRKSPTMPSSAGRPAL